MSSILEEWRALYEVAILHIALVVGDPNQCAHLVSAELYTAYRLVSRKDTISVTTQAQTHAFDLYQNAIASSVSFVTSKIQWSAVVTHKGVEDRSKCIKKLLSLLAWQLARFWDGTKKVSE